MMFYKIARKRNPLIYRNRTVSYNGANYRVANVTGGGHVLLRSQFYVHVTDVKPALSWFALRNRRDIIAALHSIDVYTITPDEALIELKAIARLLKTEREEMGLE